MLRIKKKGYLLKYFVIYNGKEGRRVRTRNATSSFIHYLNTIKPLKLEVQLIQSKSMIGYNRKF